MILPIRGVLPASGLASRRPISAELAQIRRWSEQRSPEARQGQQLQKIRVQPMRWWSQV